MSGGGKPRSIDDDLAEIRARSTPTPDTTSRLSGPPVKAETTSASGFVPEREREEGASFNPVNIVKSAVKDPRAALEALGATAGEVASAIPGGEALTAGIMSGASKIPFIGGEDRSYKDALSDLRESREKLPTTSRVGARMTGGVLSAKALAQLKALASPAATGGAYGAALPTLDADPDKTLGVRGPNAGTVLGGAGGALAGWLGESLGTATRAKFAKPVDGNIMARETARSAGAAPRYSDFRKLGDLGGTPELKAILDLPVVRRALETVKGESPTLAKMADTDATVLDAVYKRVGSKAFKALHGFETDEARVVLADAIDAAARAKGGSYRSALSAFSAPSRGIDAVERGRKTLDRANSTASIPLKKIATESPASFRADAPGFSPQEAKGAIEGVLGRAKEMKRTPRMIGPVPIPLAPSKEIGNASEMLRTLGTGSLNPRALAALMALVNRQ